MKKRICIKDSEEFVLSLRKKWPYAVTITIVICTLCILYRNLNMRMPINYSGGDEMGVFYLIKSIKESGTHFINARAGGVTGADMFDYVYSDSLSFFIVKIISLFFDNVFLIGNLFYFLNYILVACISLYVCRKLNIRNEISIVVSVLYACSVYMQSRYAHMWLTPYFLLPLSCLVAIWLCEGAFENKEKNFWKNRQFCLAVFFSFISAFTGFYYAFFACIIYAIAIVIRLLNENTNRIKTIRAGFLFIFSTITGVVLNVIPNLVYWLNNGMNQNSELSIRCLGDSETYGLKLIQLVLPRLNHRNLFFQNIAVKYSQNYPLVNENHTSSLGIVASIGLFIAIIWLFGKCEERKKNSSLLIIGLFLVGTIGGIGSVFSMLVSTPMRCYNRLSIMIMFLCLVCVAYVLESIETRMKKGLFHSILFVIMILGLYDQTVDYVQPAEQAINIESTEDFIGQIEDQMEENALIFELPYVNWPSGGFYRLFAGYLESDDLRWSFGAMQGREEALWQESVANLGVDYMLEALRSNGYSGIYLDSLVYDQISGPERRDALCNELTEKLQTSPLISENGELYFWKLN